MTQNLTNLLNMANDIWLPQWLNSFSDDENGGFHDRLDKNGRPLKMPKRLLTQCRQLIIYSLADQDDATQKCYADTIDNGFQFILKHYYITETNGSVFSLNPDNSINDHKYDLYGHAFILLACATYYQATKNTEALDFAKKTFNFIKTSFALPDKPGLTEALDENLKPIDAMRRQNPHMHLMEACIHMYEVSKDADYLATATDMLNLFYDKFLDHETQTLGEFFDDDLKPHIEKGDWIETGHHAEWIWLLKRYQDISPSRDPRLLGTMKNLFAWIQTNGIDPEYGGIFNIQSRHGSIIDTDKRIWPVLETIRAAFIMSNIKDYEENAYIMIKDLTSLLTGHYIDIKTGNWQETLTRELSSKINDMPGTTPYHIYPILREFVDYIKK